MSVSVSNPRLAIGLRLGLGLDPNADTRVKKTSGDRHKGNFVFPASVSASTCFLYSCACVCVHLFSLLLRLCLCASLGFVSNVFFRVDLCYILCSVLLHHLICNAPLLEINCASVSQYYLSFKLSGKVVFFHLFCHLSFYLFASAAIVHSLSNYIVALRDDR